MKANQSPFHELRKPAETMKPLHPLSAQENGKICFITLKWTFYMFISLIISISVFFLPLLKSQVSLLKSKMFTK